MANQEHLDILKQGVEVWNKWREDNRNIFIDLSDANFSGAQLWGVNFMDANLNNIDLRGAMLSGAILSGADMRRANLNKTDLTETYLNRADLRRANLRRANLRKANLWKAFLDETRFIKTDLSGAILTHVRCRKADFSGADLTGAYLGGADLTGTDLTGADLTGASLVETILGNANLKGCYIYGTSAWGIKLNARTKQSDLIISKHDEPIVTVDNLEVAQFIYLLLHNEKIRNILTTITTKAALILGRFTPERKAILDAIREELRKRNYIPILFDFENTPNRDLTETISTLAHLARFIIADITDAKSIPQELQAIVPHLPSVAVQPIIQAGNAEYAMFEHFTRYGWVLPLHIYESQDKLIAELSEKVIEPAEKKANELMPPSKS